MPIDTAALRALADDLDHRGPMQLTRSYTDLDALCVGVLALLAVADAAREMRRAGTMLEAIALRDEVDGAGCYLLAWAADRSSRTALDAALAALDVGETADAA